MSQTDHHCIEHVWVRLSGLGLTILPRRSFQAAYSDEPPSCLDIELMDGKFARIFPDNGGYKSKIDISTTASLYEVVEVVQGAETGRWRIETSIFAIDWPAGFDLHSDVANPCELDNRDGILCYVQILKDTPMITALQGPGQEIVDVQSEAQIPSILLSYQHDKTRWMQRHSVFSKNRSHLVVSVQFPETSRDVGEAVAQTLGASFRWVEED